MGISSDDASNLFAGRGKTDGLLTVSRPSPTQTEAAADAVPDAVRGLE